MIIVCSLKDLVAVCESIHPSHVISVIDPGYVPKTPNGINNHLKLGFDDIVEIRSDNHIFRQNIDQIDQILPNSQHINSIVNFTNLWDKSKPIVIHCWCGVSRSMATATYLMCKENILQIDQNIRYMRSIAPRANPNKLMIKLFEKSLNLNNEITKAFLKYPHTQSYDCSTNFAPITIFEYKDMVKFK